MPVRPENRGRYPKDWKQITDWVRFTRAAGRCECRGECGRPAVHLAADRRCPNEHGKRSHHTGKPVVLTTAHLDHTPETRDPELLRAFCNGCHLHYDRQHHAETRAATKRAELEAQMDSLFDVSEGE